MVGSTISKSTVHYRLLVTMVTDSKLLKQNKKKLDMRSLFLHLQTFRCNSLRSYCLYTHTNIKQFFFIKQNAIFGKSFVMLWSLTCYEQRGIIVLQITGFRSMIKIKKVVDLRFYFLKLIALSGNV